MLVPRHVWHFKIQLLAKKHLTQSAGEAECHRFGRRLHINKVLNVPARVHPETTFYVVFLVNISKDSVLFHQQKDCSHAGETDNSPRAKWAPGQWFLWSYYKLVKKTLTIKIFFFLSFPLCTHMHSFFHPFSSLLFSHLLLFLCFPLHSCLPDQPFLSANTHIKLLQSPQFTCSCWCCLEARQHKQGAQKWLEHCSLVSVSSQESVGGLECVCLMSWYNCACVLPACIKVSAWVSLFSQCLLKHTLPFMFTACLLDPEQWVPSRCAVTAAGSHHTSSQVLLSGSGTVSNECWARPLESPRGGSALGNRAGGL